MLDGLPTDGIRWGTLVRCPHPDMLEAIAAEGFDLAILEASSFVGDRDLTVAATVARQLNLEVCLRVSPNELAGLKVGLALGFDRIQVRSVRDPSDFIDYISEGARLPLSVTSGTALVPPCPRLILEIDWRSKETDVANIAKAAPSGSVLLVVPSGFSVVHEGEVNFLKLEQTRAAEAILEICAERNLGVGVYTDSARDAYYWQTRGLSLIEFATDIDIFRSGVRNARRQMNGGKKRKPISCDIAGSPVGGGP